MKVTLLEASNHFFFSDISVSNTSPEDLYEDASHTRIEGVAPMTETMSTFPPISEERTSVSIDDGLMEDLYDDLGYMNIDEAASMTHGFHDDQLIQKHASYSSSMENSCQNSVSRPTAEVGVGGFRHTSPVPKPPPHSQGKLVQILVCWYELNCVIFWLLIFSLHSACQI